VLKKLRAKDKQIADLTAQLRSPEQQSGAQVRHWGSLHTSAITLSTIVSLIRSWRLLLLPLFCSMLSLRSCSGSWRQQGSSCRPSKAQPRAMVSPQQTQGSSCVTCLQEQRWVGACAFAQLVVLGTPQLNKELRQGESQAQLASGTMAGLLCLCSARLHAHLASALLSHQFNTPLHTHHLLH
jgi:hypothetical protein